jgi:hypothetical protein
MKKQTQYHASGHAGFSLKNGVAETEKLNRLCWLTSNEFILEGNEWHHLQEPIMIKQSIVETATVAEWDILIDSIEYFTI